MRLKTMSESPLGDILNLTTRRRFSPLDVERM